MRAKVRFLLMTGNMKWMLRSWMGKNLAAGAVAGCRNVKNPVLLAKAVMEQTEHVLLCGEGAEAFARKINLPFEDDAYFFDQLQVSIS